MKIYTDIKKFFVKKAGILFLLFFSLGKNKYKLILIFLIAIIIGSFFYLQKYHTYNKQLPFYYDLNISAMHLAGKSGTYAIKDGKIFRDGVILDHWYQENERIRALKLALFYEINKEDPLLFDPNLDSKSFDEAVARMKEPNEMLNNRTGWGWANPIDFLEKFSIASTAYKNFSEDISENNAEHLNLAIENAVKSYYQDAERIGKVFDNAVNKGEGTSEMTYLAGDTSVNLQTIDDDFQKIRKNADALKTEAKNRKNCLKNLECVRNVLDFGEPNILVNEKEGNPSPLPLDEIISPLNKVDKKIFNIESSCWGGRNRNYLNSGVRCDLGVSFCMDWPILSEGEYYTEPGKYTKELLAPEEIKLQPQSATAPYGCNDLTYKPKIRTMAYSLNNFNKERLFDYPFEKENANNFWLKGREVENSFFTSETPTDTEFKNLANFYKFAYARLSKDNTGSQEIRDKFLQRANIMQGMLAQFDLVLNRSAYHFNSFMRLHGVEENFLDRKIEYIFANRSDYSITFLGFSPFVWRSDDTLKFTLLKSERRLSPVAFENRPILNHETAIRVYGRNEINKWREMVWKIRENIQEE